MRIYREFVIGDGDDDSVLTVRWIDETTGSEIKALTEKQVGKRLNWAWLEHPSSILEVAGYCRE